MFTGLVVETGKLVSFESIGASARLKVQAPTVGPPAALGDSIAVNGCCLTVTEREGDILSFDLLAETLRRTNLGQLGAGSVVNLEPALGAGAKMGGHFVQGHVDTTAEILEYSENGADHRFEVALAPEFRHFVVSKGSICLDGISLTVAEVLPASLVCWIIPTTHTVTNLHTRHAGESVNVEFDMLAKYVERILEARLPARA